ncbi:hypothetical protein Pse7367_2228 [Thalassoporum mexicanum PCC 7367]|uniref:phosphoribosyltransferase-like protein n=1 Tax=Thalassoporum mexicanum TaxID=3457544 RepID=UPI00029FA424|nr:hypothetical protein [Pseudanabaena sp. PCC 7367]AFY70492.1 hypothetical protein Pse7367_2228 [Pseudanabaena sp. PCC 7367]
MSDRYQYLLKSIAAIIADYRQDEISCINSSHVDRWVKQFEPFGFDKNAQIVILQQMEYLLSKYYFSRLKVQNLLDGITSSEKIFGSNPLEAISKTKFLQIQSKGNSQNDLLEICNQKLQSKYGLSINECGNDQPEAYIYLDDCLYSGDTATQDIKSWLPDTFSGAKLHMVFFAIHSLGHFYFNKNIESEVQSGGIELRFWRKEEFSNSRWERDKFDCFWPCSSPNDRGNKLVDDYVKQIEARRSASSNPNRPPPIFRPNNVPTEEHVFSSAKSRQVIESAFLKAGAYIVSLPEDPNSSMKPLGYERFHSLGFGALFTTYRNIANNCPLALWWGDPDKPYPLNQWYPLFPRIVNEQANYD